MKRRLLAITLILMLLLSLAGCKKNESVEDDKTTPQQDTINENIENTDATGDTIAPPNDLYDNNTITPEWLIDNSHPDGLSLDANITMLADAIIKIDPTELGIDSLEMILTMSGNLQRDGDIEHIVAEMDIFAAGENIVQSLDQWSTPEKTWAWNGETWIASEGYYESIGDVVNLSSDAFKNLALTEENGEYIVTGIVDPTNENSTTLSAETLTGLTSDGEMELQVQIRFDTATKHMKSLHMDVLTSEEGDITYETFSYDFEIQSLGEISLELPEEFLTDTTEQVETQPEE